MKASKMIGANAVNARKTKDGFLRKTRDLPLRAQKVTEAANQWLRNRGYVSQFGLNSSGAGK